MTTDCSKCNPVLANRLSESVLRQMQCARAGAKACNRASFNISCSVYSVSVTHAALFIMFELLARVGQYTGNSLLIGYILSTTS